MTTKGVHYNCINNLELSRAENSRFYLIHAKEFQLRIWLHSTDGGNDGNWALVDTILIGSPVLPILGWLELGTMLSLCWWWWIAKSSGFILGAGQWRKCSR